MRTRCGCDVCKADRRVRLVCWAFLAFTALYFAAQIVRVL